MFTRELTPLSYKITMPAFRSPLSDGNLAVEGIHILGCFDSGYFPMGFAQYKDYEKTCVILDMACGENRDKVISALTNEIIQRCEEKHLEKIFWNTELDVVPGNFTEERCDRVYRAEKKDLSCWEAFKAQVAPVLRRAEHSGFITVPLSACTEAQVEKIEKLYRAGHDSAYMACVLKSEDGKLLSDMSFVALREDDVAAFAIFSETDENGCMLKYLYARPDFRNTAAMLIPLSRGIDAFQESAYQNLRFTIKSDNLYSLNFLARRFPGIRPRVSIYSYVLDLTREKTE